jgi:hypothetical protein
MIGFTFGQWSPVTAVNACVADRYSGDDENIGYSGKRVMLPMRDLLLQKMNPEREYTVTELIDICGVWRGKIEPELVLMKADGLAEHGSRKGNAQRKWHVTEKAGNMYQPSGFDALALSQCFGNYTYRSNKNGIRQ